MNELCARAGLLQFPPVRTTTLSAGKPKALFGIIDGDRSFFAKQRFGMLPRHFALSSEHPGEFGHAIGFFQQDDF